MSEHIVSFLADVVLGVLMYIIMRVLVRGAKVIWRKLRTPKDPVIA